MPSLQRNNKGRFLPASAQKPVDVRNAKQANVLENMIHAGPMTLILIYADWCGHCQTYKPTWEDLEKTPGRVANIASVHHDMMENVPTIKNATIEGYPSVIKVSPDGAIETYKVPGNENKTTNAMPMMRDEEAMKKELTTILPVKNSEEPGVQGGVTNVVSENIKSELTGQKGGSVSIAAAFVSAIQAAGPAALLLATHAILPKSSTRRHRTYRSPKRSNHRGGTRRRRRY